jgi:hypothetical protein
MLQRILLGLVLCSSIVAPAHATFIPDPTPPPIITNSSGTRWFTPAPGQGAPGQATGAGSR